MSILHSEQTQNLINRLARDSSELAEADSEQFLNFVRDYYHGVPYEDLAKRDLFDLKGAAHAHWHLAKVRKKSEIKVRVYSPDVERDGWRSKHMVLEMVAMDRPFIVDSISMIFKELGLRVHSSIHPVLAVQRNDNGEIQKLAAANKADFLNGVFESLLHVEFDKPLDEQTVKQIETRVIQTLELIECAVTDWKEMRKRGKSAAKNLIAQYQRTKDSDLEEYSEFCSWLVRGNFTLLGYFELDNSQSGSSRVVADSVLGILRKFNDINEVLPVQNFGMNEPETALTITKSNLASPIHRAIHMDLVSVPNYSDEGEFVGVRVVIGLFGSTAYNSSAVIIPHMRNKIKYVLRKSKFAETTHSLRALTNIVDNYPRDVLFEVNGDDLFEDVAGILELQERQKVKVFIRRERYRRYYSVIVYIPQELFSRELRIKIEQILMDSLVGESSEFVATFSAAVLARITYSIFVDQNSEPKRDLPAIQQLVEDAAVTWFDSLESAAIERYGQDQGLRYFKEYANSFNASYQEDVLPWVAAVDLDRLASLNSENDLVVSFFSPLKQTGDSGERVKLYSYCKQISPSVALPYFENMGLRVIEERPYEIRRGQEQAYWLHDFKLALDEGMAIDVNQNRDIFEEAFGRIWRGEAENDGFNKLVLAASLTWRQVVLLRACCRYLRQIGTTFSETYIIQTLVRNVNLVSNLVTYFELKFDPTSADCENEIKHLLEDIESELDQVKSLDEDIILRSYLNLISSMIRTNFYCQDKNGDLLQYFSFKFDASKILKMPDPRPKFEIFVYSTRVEAVHLRGGSVARGGLRWSDRREDFRTEVLGLVKAQMVKNAVIVPVGSKGGFVVKLPPRKGYSMLEEGIACYRTFIRGMLDITDNIVGDEIIQPQNVKCYDDLDPYLVVAADKGTATFSDIANSLSEEYGFWLGDAFASGGSEGYDHKGMGITARGGWESVKRHFREMGTDIQTTDFTVIGIGDMSGDVFGNGMLLSRHIRLVAAFNHIEIFIDPSPNSSESFVERERLFNSPGLTWKDYNKDLISEGGGVFPRTAKSIDITPQMQRRFKIEDSKLTPNELLHAMLKAPVDLLWNGGIGTYVKATTESHADAANRSNDTVRVNGNELGSRVVGEGGNLGMTQLGRIEYCLNGGRCYTDFIDNSGGVDCSDHEVNIKILLNQKVNNGDMTTKQRNHILREMTDEVAELVLVDNYQQSQALSLLQVHSKRLLNEHYEMIRTLVAAGQLNRRLEFLPNREEKERREQLGLGLQYPELSVLLAYSKMVLYPELLHSDFPDEPYLVNELREYFPVQLSESCANEMLEHRLKREIIATYVTNNMINRVGPTFTFRMQQFSGASNAEITRSFCVAKEIFSLNQIWKEIEELDNKVSAQTQMKMLSYAEGLVQRITLWLLRHRSFPISIKETVDYYKAGTESLISILDTVLTEEDTRPMKKQVKSLVDSGVPNSLAETVINCISLSTALDIVEIVIHSQKDVAFVAAVYFQVGARLELLWIRQKVVELPVENHWHSRAKSRLSDDIHSHQYAIANDVVRMAETDDPEKAVTDWMESKKIGCKMLAGILADMKALPKIDFATLSVAISEVNSLGRTTE